MTHLILLDDGAQWKRAVLHRNLHLALFISDKVWRPQVKYVILFPFFTAYTEREGYFYWFFPSSSKIHCTLLHS